MKSILRLITYSSLLTFSIPGFGMDINLNGFGSVYWGQALTKDLLPAHFSDEHVNFTNFSLIGLNAGSKLGEHLGAALQIVGLGTPIGSTEDYALIAQWAYLTYDSEKGTFIKAGRQLYPLYIASEYIRVAFLTPFRSLPTPVKYLSPFTRFDGVSIHHKFNLEGGTLTLGAFVGNPLLDSGASTSNTYAGSTFSFSDLAGVQVTWDGDGYRLRALASRSYSRAIIPALSNLNLPTTYEGHSQTYTLGYRFEKFNLVSWGEYGLTRTPDGTYYPLTGSNFGGVGHMLYVLGGYRIGDFLPRYTFSNGSTTYGVLDATLTTHTVGVNYQIHSQATIKAEFERAIVPFPGAASTIFKQPFGTNVTYGDAFYLGADFIF